MEKEIKKKAQHLISKTRVMTLAVSKNDIPWSAPVYFVVHDNQFYFFSNEQSRHIQYAKGEISIAASIFHDADQIDQIFGFQMSGALVAVSKMTVYLTVVKKYVAKFNFLEQVFGPQVIENKRFFLEKFKSRLYCFQPDQIFLSDNATAAKKRLAVNLEEIT